MAATRRPPSPQPTIRPARLADIPALVRLEHRSFEGDRLSPRSFRHMLRHANAATIVEEEGGRLRGYAMLLFNRRSSLARLYSFAVDSEHRGKGIAKLLLAESERIARKQGCDRLRLEVRADNKAAQQLYGRRGYEIFGKSKSYYEDGADAVRMEKRLRSLSGTLPALAAISLVTRPQIGW